MKVKIILLLALPVFLSTSTVFNYVAYAVEERKFLNRNYLGLGVEVYAPYECYPGDTIAVRVRVEASEDVKNASVTLFLWSSKSEGSSPWSTSFTVLDVTDFPNGTIKEEPHNIMIPSDIDPGLTYGILFLDWSIYRQSWESQWDKASFRATYVENKDYENLQVAYDSVLTELQNTRTLMYVFLAATITLVISTVYFGKRKTQA